MLVTIPQEGQTVGATNVACETLLGCLSTMLLLSLLQIVNNTEARVSLSGVKIQTSYLWVTLIVFLMVIKLCVQFLVLSDGAASTEAILNTLLMLVFTGFASVTSVWLISGLYIKIRFESKVLHTF